MRTPIGLGEAMCMCPSPNSLFPPAGFFFCSFYWLWQAGTISCSQKQFLWCQKWIHWFLGGSDVDWQICVSNLQGKLVCHARVANPVSQLKHEPKYQNFRSPNILHSKSFSQIQDADRLWSLNNSDLRVLGWVKGLFIGKSYSFRAPCSLPYSFFVLHFHLLSLTFLASWKQISSQSSGTFFIFCYMFSYVF